MSLPRIRFEPARDLGCRSSRRGGVGHYESWDIFGNYHASTVETELRILSSIGVPCSSLDELEQPRINRFQSRVEKLLPITLVIGEHDKAVELAMRADADPHANFELRLESGGRFSGARTAAARSSQGDGVARPGMAYYRLGLPAELPLGYHTIRVSTAEAPNSSDLALIVCPDRAFLPNDLQPDCAYRWVCGDALGPALEPELGVRGFQRPL